MQDLLSLAYPVLLLAGVIAAIVRRRRLGPAAAPAIAGFAVLIVHFGAELWWGASVSAWYGREGRVVFSDGLPSVSPLPTGQLTVGAVLAAVHAAGLLLLIVAVVRGRSQVLEGNNS